MKRISKPSAIRKEIVFLKDELGWFATGIEGTRQQNAMVGGADKFLDVLARGKDRVKVIFSADVEKPGAYKMKLHRIEHDPFGATYRVSRGTTGAAPKFKGLMGLPVMWICNQCEKFLGEHPRDIFVHAVS